MTLGKYRVDVGVGRLVLRQDLHEAAAAKMALDVHSARMEDA